MVATPSHLREQTGRRLVGPARARASSLHHRSMCIGGGHFPPLGASYGAMAAAAVPPSTHLTVRVPLPGRDGTGGHRHGAAQRAERRETPSPDPRWERLPSEGSRSRRAGRPSTPKKAGNSTRTYL